MDSEILAMNQKRYDDVTNHVERPDGALAILVDGPYDSGLTPEWDDGGPYWPLVWVDAEGSELNLIGYAETYEAACAWGREIARAHRVELDIEALPA
jgi:hypothetical protein